MLLPVPATAHVWVPAAECLLLPVPATAHMQVPAATAVWSTLAVAETVSHCLARGVDSPLGPVALQLLVQRSEYDHMDQTERCVCGGGGMAVAGRVRF